MRLAGLAVALLTFSRGAAALELTARVHYPEKHSAVDLCGFTFEVHVAAVNDPATTVAVASAKPHGKKKDLFVAKLNVDDQFLLGEVVVAVLAVIGGSDLFYGDKCGSVCPGMGPQGNMVQSGPYTRTSPLEESNVMDLWPDFACRGWSSRKISFFSPAIKKMVYAVARLPAAQQENPMPRPSALLPAVLFRLNSEWYWGNASTADSLPDMDSATDYNVWHSLMVSGAMQSVVVVEVYLQGVDWKSWSNQPIFSTEGIKSKCPHCPRDLKFICDKWRNDATTIYGGGDHHFGSAATFFQELYSSVVPGVLALLPERTDSPAYASRTASLQAAAEAAVQRDGPLAQAEAVGAAALAADGGVPAPGSLRVGVWGYCIGGLGAWSAISQLPQLFNMAYLGSPAVDFDCGDPFRGVANISVSPLSMGASVRAGAAQTALIGGGQLRPLIYIDSGAEEALEMNRQTLMLFRKLEARGLVPGHDLFYSRAPFGTHQSRMMLRRAMKAMLVMFGASVPGAGASDEVALATQGLETGVTVNALVEAADTYLPSVQRAEQPHPHKAMDTPSSLPLIATSVVSFVAGLAVMRLARGAGGPQGSAGAPLLA